MYGYQYDPYQMPLGYLQPAATHFSIDVECVATGRDHNSRSVAQFALVVSPSLQDAATRRGRVLAHTITHECAGPVREGPAECVSYSHPGGTLQLELDRLPGFCLHAHEKNVWHLVYLLAGMIGHADAAGM